MAESVASLVTTVTLSVENFDDVPGVVTSDSESTSGLSPGNIKVRWTKGN